MRITLALLLLMWISPSLLFAQNNKLKFTAFDSSGCGINFAYGVSPIASRYATGTGFPAKVSIAGIPAGAEILKGYLYTVHSYQTGSADNMNYRITNSQSIFNDYFNQTVLDKDIPKCNGEVGSKIYRLDITNSISGNGTYRLTFNNSSIENEVDGICLVVIYKDPKALYEGHLSINDGLITSTNGSIITNTMTIPPVCNTELFSKSFALLADLEIIKGATHSSTLNSNNLPLVPNLFFQMDMDSLNGVTQDQGTGVFQFKSNDLLNSDCFSLCLTGMYYQTKVCRNCNCDIKSDFNFKNGCPETTINFSSNVKVNKGGPISKYVWNFGDGQIDSSSAKNNSHIYKNPGKYTVSLRVENSDNPKCSEIISKEITIYDLPKIVLGTNNVNAYVISKSAGTSVIWDNDASLNTDTIYNVKSGWHTIRATNTENCVQLDSIQVFEILPNDCISCCYNEVKIPNAFNPNNAKNNFQKFISADLNCFQKIHFIILDRWGKVVYESDNLSDNWNGNSAAGEALSNGLYFIKLDYTKQNNSIGNVTKGFSLVR